MFQHFKERLSMMHKMVTYSRVHHERYKDISPVLQAKEKQLTKCCRICFFNKKVLH
jgi:hypothetical protein